MLTTEWVREVLLARSVNGNMTQRRVNGYMTQRRVNGYITQRRVNGYMTQRRVNGYMTQRRVNAYITPNHRISFLAALATRLKAKNDYNKITLPHSHRHSACCKCTKRRINISNLRATSLLRTVSAFHTINAGRRRVTPTVLGNGQVLALGAGIRLVCTKVVVVVIVMVVVVALHRSGGVSGWECVF